MPSKYSFKVENPAKAVYARGSNLKVHFKNTRETAMALKGRTLKNAQQYLNDVLGRKQAVPFRRFVSCIGRKAQGKNFKNHTSRQVRWPEKSCEYLLGLLRNAEANATVKELNPETLKIVHVQVDEAPKMRRRTYRAHGRIGPYLRCPCHIQLILTEPSTTVPKAPAPAGGDDDMPALSQ